MNSTDDDILQRVRIPEDDGKLSQALADLDSKLAAWSGAIHHAQSSLRDIARNQSVSLPEEPEIPQVESIREDLSETPSEQPAPPVDGENELVSENTDNCQVSEEPTISAPASAPSIPAESGENDEALLATLDPVTAKRIQVLRRLSGNTKSIRELIEKHGVNPAPVPAQPNNKKSFWRR